MAKAPTAIFNFDGRQIDIDLSQGIDLSIAISDQPNQVNAYFAEPVKIEPFRLGSFVGEVKLGGTVNYRNIFFNPHGHGTHTECVGHIDQEIHSINQHFKDFWQLAHLISVRPEVKPNADEVIDLTQLDVNSGTTALIIRTLPNSVGKRNKKYSGANPPYVTEESIKHLVSLGIEHVLIDLPSLDREVDEGKLLGHNAFFKPGGKSRMASSITELIFVSNEAEDGQYLLNLQVAPFENDASPSRPIIYPILSK
jgi:arylformamidase